MTDHNTMPGKIHQGRNIKRFREMLGIKQEALAHEQKETVEDAILAQVSEILRIPVEAIQNFDEEQAVNTANTFNQGSFYILVILQHLMSIQLINLFNCMKRR